MHDHLPPDVDFSSSDVQSKMQDLTFSTIGLLHIKSSDHYINSSLSSLPTYAMSKSSSTSTCRKPPCELPKCEQPREDTEPSELVSRRDAVPG